MRVLCVINGGRLSALGIMTQRGEGVTSVGTFLRDPNKYLGKVQRKSRETPKDWTDRRDCAQPLSHWWGK